MEFAPGSSTTAYLGFRAPLEPTGDRRYALIIPVTNLDQLVTGGATTAAFGAPTLLDLGGLGIREIRKNADGQYLLLAGTPDDTNNAFRLYSWDGELSDPPLADGTTLPLEPAGANEGTVGDHRVGAGPAGDRRERARFSRTTATPPGTATR